MLLLCLALSREFQRKISDQKTGVLIGDVLALARPNHGRVVSREPGVEHLLDLVPNRTASFSLSLLARDALFRVLDELGDVRVFLEAVPNAIVVQVEAGVRSSESTAVAVM